MVVFHTTDLIFLVDGRTNLIPVNNLQTVTYFPQETVYFSS